MSDSEPDTSRALVQTYVPAYQREQWDEHAQRLEMSRSEFVRTMVQAGRRGFGADADGHAEEGDVDDSAGDLEQRVREQLRDGACSWDELLSGLTDDIETRLEETLQRLQDDGTVRYSGPEGGYVLEVSDE